MEKKIYILEDDERLVEKAQEVMNDTYTSVIAVGIGNANTPTYWRGLNIKSRDLVILDLNLKQAGVRYSGKDVLRILESEKRQGNLAGLEQVLVATSVQGEVDPHNVSPDIALIDGFDVYGMEKGTSEREGIDIDKYGASLSEAIADIYAGRAEALNKGWRSG
jgi:hypothetical protein